MFDEDNDFHSGWDTDDGAGTVSAPLYAQHHHQRSAAVRELLASSSGRGPSASGAAHQQQQQQHSSVDAGGGDGMAGRVPSAKAPSVPRIGSASNLRQGLGGGHAHVPPLPSIPNHHSRAGSGGRARSRPPSAAASGGDDGPLPLSAASAPAGHYLPADSARRPRVHSYGVHAGLQPSDETCSDLVNTGNGTARRLVVAVGGGEGGDTNGAPSDGDEATVTRIPMLGDGDGYHSGRAAGARNSDDDDDEEDAATGQTKAVPSRGGGVTAAPPTTKRRGQPTIRAIEGQVSPSASELTEGDIGTGEKGDGAFVGLSGGNPNNNNNNGGVGSVPNGGGAPSSSTSHFLNTSGFVRIASGELGGFRPTPSMAYMSSGGGMGGGGGGGGGSAIASGDETDINNYVQSRQFRREVMQNQHQAATLLGRSGGSNGLISGGNARDSDVRRQQTHSSRGTMGVGGFGAGGPSAAGLMGSGNARVYGYRAPRLHERRAEIVRERYAEGLSTPVRVGPIGGTTTDSAVGGWDARAAPKTFDKKISVFAPPPSTKVGNGLAPTASNKALRLRKQQQRQGRRAGATNRPPKVGMAIADSSDEDDEYYDTYGGGTAATADGWDDRAYEGEGEAEAGFTEGEEEEQGGATVRRTVPPPRHTRKAREALEEYISPAITHSHHHSLTAARSTAAAHHTRTPLQEPYNMHAAGGERGAPATAETEPLPRRPSTSAHDGEQRDRSHSNVPPAWRGTSAGTSRPRELSVGALQSDARTGASEERKRHKETPHDRSPSKSGNPSSPSPHSNHSSSPARAAAATLPSICGSPSLRSNANSQKHLSPKMAGATALSVSSGSGGASPLSHKSSPKAKGSGAPAALKSATTTDATTDRRGNDSPRSVSTNSKRSIGAKERERVAMSSPIAFEAAALAIEGALRSPSRLEAIPLTAATDDVEAKEGAMKNLEAGYDTPTSDAQPPPSIPDDERSALLEAIAAAAALAAKAEEELDALVTRRKEARAAATAKTESAASIGAECEVTKAAIKATERAVVALNAKKKSAVAALREAETKERQIKEVERMLKAVKERFERRKAEKAAAEIPPKRSGGPLPPLTARPSASVSGSTTPHRMLGTSASGADGQLTTTTTTTTTAVLYPPGASLKEKTRLAAARRAKLQKQLTALRNERDLLQRTVSEAEARNRQAEIVRAAQQRRVAADREAFHAAYEKRMLDAVEREAAKIRENHERAVAHRTRTARQADEERAAAVEALGRATGAAAAKGADAAKLISDLQSAVARHSADAEAAEVELGATVAEAAGLKARIGQLEALGKEREKQLAAQQRELSDVHAMGRVTTAESKATSTDAQRALSSAQAALAEALSKAARAKQELEAAVEADEKATFRHDQSIAEHGTAEQLNIRVGETNAAIDALTKERGRQAALFADAKARQEAQSLDDDRTIENLTKGLGARRAAFAAANAKNSDLLQKLDTAERLVAMYNLKGSGS